MKVYFLKENINEYIIFPTPESLEQYFELDIESEQELENKTPVLIKNKIALVEKQPTKDHEWDGKSWVIPKEKQTELLIKRKNNLMQLIANKTDNFKSQYLIH